jgi:hypothetical protein
MQGQTIGGTLDRLYAATVESQRHIASVRSMLGIGVAMQEAATMARKDAPITPPPTRRRRRRGAVTAWTAGSNARRVPSFVIEATGLKTKTGIVQRYGEGAHFAKGKPLPPLLVVPKAALKAVRRGGRAATVSQQQAAVH